jgi:hypothetical protein
LLSRDVGFYINTSQSHSGHTVSAAEQHHVGQIGLPAVHPMLDVVQCR